MHAPRRLDAEELLLPAIASKQSDEPEVFDEAVKSARLRGADPNVLDDETATQ